MHQRGNVLFIILIAIALYGAFSFAVSDLGEGNVHGTLTEEQANLYADDILSWAESVENGVQYLLNARSCSEQEINFENDVFLSYTNSSALASNSSPHVNPRGDYRCHVFHPEGANVTARFMPFEATMSPNDPTREHNRGNVSFQGFPIEGVGEETKMDMTVRIHFLSYAVCSEINRRMVNSAVPYLDDTVTVYVSLNGNGYNSAYAESGSLDFTDNTYVGSTSFCHPTGAAFPGVPTFLHVLHVR